MIQQSKRTNAFCTIPLVLKNRACGAARHVSVAWTRENRQHFGIGGLDSRLFQAALGFSAKNSSLWSAVGYLVLERNFKRPKMPL